MITDRAVEAAALAIYRLAVRDMHADDWPHLSEGRRRGYRVIARAALEAARATQRCDKEER